MATPLQGIRILAVDDQRDALEALCVFLQMNGATTESADSARAALDLVKAVEPDVILSDLSMPGMDGVEFIRELRNRGYATPAVAVSAFHDRQWRERALAAGFESLITKPVDFAALIAAVQRLARRDAAPAAP